MLGLGFASSWESRPFEVAYLALKACSSGMQVNKSEGAGVSWSKFGADFAWEVAALLSGQNLPQPPVSSKEELLERWSTIFPSHPAPPVPQ